jgi:flagellar biosynthetic protein FliQ
MNLTLFLELTNKALFITGLLALPILIPGLIAGIAISLFQAVTQISEQTLTFVPKLFILIISFLIFGAWITQMMVDYTHELITRIPDIVQAIG